MLMELASPTTLQTRSPRCWQWMKKRLRPEGRTRTPKPVSLLSRVSYADLRGRSAVTRAAVRVILDIHLLPVAVAAGERRVAESVPLQQLSGEKTTLFQIVRTEGAQIGVDAVAAVGVGMVDAVNIEPRLERAVCASARRRSCIGRRGHGRVEPPRAPLMRSRTGRSRRAGRRRRACARQGSCPT